MRLCRFDRAIWQLWLDVTVLFDLMKSLSDKTARHVHILRGLNRAIDAFATGAVDPRPLVAATVPLAETGSILAGVRPAGSGAGPKFHIDPRR